MYGNNTQARFHSTKGFTLLELLVALTIGAFLIVASGAIIKSSMRLMDRGEKRLRGDLRKTSALEFWREQVSAIPPGYSRSAGFVGKKRDLSFVTPVRLNLRGKGFVIAHYTVKKEEGNKYRLIYKEKRFTTARKTQGEKGSEGLVLLEGYDKIGFEYLGAVTEGKNLWESEWVEELHTPRALKLTLVQEKEKRDLIAPIVATSSFLSSGQ